MEQSTYSRAPALALLQLNSRTNRNKTVTKVISYLLGACAWKKGSCLKGNLHPQSARAGKLGSESQVNPALFTLLEHERRELRRASLAVEM